MSSLYPAQQPFKFDPKSAFGDDEDSLARGRSDLSRRTGSTAAADRADPYSPSDRVRLTKQQAAFDAFMVQADRFVTLAEIQAGTVASYPPHGIPGPSASARFRETTLAKDKYRIGGGLWAYKCWRQT